MATIRRTIRRSETGSGGIEIATRHPNMPLSHRDQMHGRYTIMLRSLDALMNRTARWGRCIALLALLTLLPCMLSGCGKPSFVEAGRINGPDGSMDAVVLEGGIDATSPYNYMVCIVPKGRSCGIDNAIAEVFGATRSAQAYGVDVVWQSATQLEVRYLTANRAELLHPSSVTAKSVDILFRSGVENTRAPSGAMVKGG